MNTNYCYFYFSIRKFLIKCIVYHVGRSVEKYLNRKMYKQSNLRWNWMRNRNVTLDFVVNTYILICPEGRANRKLAQGLASRRASRIYNNIILYYIAGASNSNDAKDLAKLKNGAVYYIIKNKYLFSVIKCYFRSIISKTYLTFRAKMIICKLVYPRINTP